METEYSGLISSTGLLYLGITAGAILIGVSMWKQRLKDNADYVKGTEKHNAVNGIYTDVQVEKYTSTSTLQLYIPDDYEGIGYEPGELVTCKLWGLKGCVNRDYTLELHNYHSKQAGGTKNAYSKTSVQFLPSREGSMPEIIMQYADGTYANVVSAQLGFAIPDPSEPASNIPEIIASAKMAQANNSGVWGMPKGKRNGLIFNTGGKKK